MAKERNNSLDIAKGFSILLIVFAHGASPIMQGHHAITWFYNIISSLILTVFSFTAGYVATKLVTKPTDKLTLIKQRAMRLLVPYFVWAFIYAPMKIILTDHVRNKYEYKWYTLFFGNSPNGQLWYLYLLFIVSVITILFVTKKNLPVITIIFLAVSMVAQGIPDSLSFTSVALNFSLYQFGFFFLGIFVSLNKDFKSLFSKFYLCLISSVVFITYCVILWIKGHRVWYLEGISGLAFLYLSFYLSILIEKSKLKNALTYTGKISMNIYILHGPLLVIGRIFLPKLISNTYLYIITLGVITILLSLLITTVINKIKPARFLLFGSK